MAMLSTFCFREISRPSSKQKLHKNYKRLLPNLIRIFILRSDWDYFRICQTTWRNDLLNRFLTESLTFDLRGRLENYVLFRKDRHNRCGGGVALFVSSTVHCKRLPEIELKDSLTETLWVHLRPRRLPRSVSCIFYIFFLLCTFYTSH